ncbi:MAG TPA: peptidase M23 [Flavobacteriaceae bacterium]|jgi:murein DD-endopeptidase MepM/ murein hydrolase activator NlpD|nr:peptidase M23 [Flavobacteriaceae bacterium]
MARKTSGKKSFRKRLVHKYRLLVLNEDTFEERFSFRLNRLNVFVITVFSALGLILGTTLLIALTPLREYIPGYASTKLIKQAASLSELTDSLQQRLAANDTYLQSIREVLTGNLKPSALNKDSIIEAVAREVDAQLLAASKEDSLLRERVQQEDKYNPLSDESGQDFVLFPPVSGVITGTYDPEEKHFAIDVATVKNTPVKATADGTVILAEWNADTGYVVVLRHKDNLISVYKHNASLSVAQGDLVKSGEVIAASGNTGALTTGPHLHFELWSDGYPINPTNFIDFN